MQNTTFMEWVGNELKHWFKRKGIQTRDETSRHVFSGKLASPLLLKTTTQKSKEQRKDGRGPPRTQLHADIIYAILLFAINCMLLLLSCITKYLPTH